MFMRCLTFAAAVALAAAATSGFAQTTPSQNGLRFDRPAVKTPAALAQDPGGPKERIEVQSTDDHIDYVVKTYVLKHANASEVYDLIQTAVEKEGGQVSRIAAGSSADVDAQKLECTTKYDGESLLVVTVPQWMIAYLDQTIATLDRPGLEASAFGTASLYARIKHRLPSEVAELIQETAASPYIVLKPDDTRQLLYVEDTPSFFGYDLEALRTFDVPPAQIQTRVRIFEIQEANTRDVGLDWEAWKKSIGGGGLTFNWESNPGSYNLNLQSFTADLSFSPALATEFLNYLVSKGHAEVLTDSRLTQINSQPATVQSVLQVPYVVRGYLDEERAADSTLRDSPAPLDADGLIKEFTEGVVVEMTPRIGDEIELSVNASVSSHVGYTPGQNVPLIASSEVNTTALLLPGQPALLGGLSRKSTVTERPGVVGLRSVPGLRRLFSREVTRTQTSQVVITIELDRASAGETPTPLKKAMIPPADL